MYNDKHLVSVHNSHDPVMGVRFGRFGREENTMVMTHASGALGIKILPRHAPLEVKDSSGAPPEQVCAPVSSSCADIMLGDIEGRVGLGLGRR